MRTISNPSINTELDLIELIHPGEILGGGRDRGLGSTQNRLAVSIGVPPRRINEIVHGNRGITADTAIRLAWFRGTLEASWMNLQWDYELRLDASCWRWLTNRSEGAQEILLVWLRRYKVDQPLARVAGVPRGSDQHIADAPGIAVRPGGAGSQLPDDAWIARASDLRRSESMSTSGAHPSRLREQI